MFKQARGTSTVLCKNCGRGSSYKVRFEETRIYLYCGDCGSFIKFVSSSGLKALRECGCKIQKLSESEIAEIEYAKHTKGTSSVADVTVHCPKCGSDTVTVQTKNGVNVLRCADCNAYIKNVSDASLHALRKLGRVKDVADICSGVGEPFDFPDEQGTPAEPCVDYEVPEVGSLGGDSLDASISEEEQSAEDESCGFCEGTLVLEDTDTRVKLLIEPQVPNTDIYVLEVVDRSGTVIGEFKVDYCPFCKRSLSSRK